ncbi:hypothetical protein AFK24_24975 [Pseudomonas syringae]|uniref:Uncharacterized protein n=1 Tax=Pseudomonas syringae TaxID=317 RepID=A0A1C7YZL8_PSESX|nr:hypothetical protein AFK24_24975 [Pseudomonas syringae]
MQRGGSKIINLVLAPAFDRHFSQRSVEHLLEQQPDMSARKPTATPALQSLAAPNGVLPCCIDEYVQI